ncbi:MAG TPA: long-chain fatty acid--CoA ligase [Jiangellaceae bacterium]|nr:long-chain fatty acid--CoA ligase [Jiangellaceae bacterium]
MLSTMMDEPLLIRRLLEHGGRMFARSQVITATEGGFRSSSYVEVAANAARLASALTELGVRPGQRVATFMWNNVEHVEAYFAVPAMGAVIHPLNIRLFPEQVVYIANHAGDRVVIVDNTLLDGFAKLLPRLRTVQHVVVNGPADLSVLEGTGVVVHDYAMLLAGRAASFQWPEVDERSAAAMCYTSGTTGHPKGVVYSHRSIYLHSFCVALPDGFALSSRDSVLSVVPQFHVLAWGLPYAAFLTGASLAMPDRFLAPEPLADFIAAARPNKAAGVPTVWTGLIRHVEENPKADISSLTEAVVGGSACPPALMEAYDRHGITLLHAWGMTETSPLGTHGRPPAASTGAERLRYRLTQGRLVAPVEARLVGPDGEEVPWDGESVGELEVRGPWVTGSYFREPESEAFDEGWLRTGDVGAITPDGYLRLTDRVKDVIKSGGEWISSVELEGHLMAHPAVAEAAVVGVPDDHWGERPLGVVVPAPGSHAAPDELRGFLAERVAGWQLPERWAYVAEIPKTSVGKFDKKALRHAYAHDDLDVIHLPR